MRSRSLPAARRLSWVLGPAVLGVLASAILHRVWPDQPEIYLSADIAGLLWVLGLGMTIVMGGVLAVRARSQRDLAAARELVLARSGEEHRRFVRRLDHELKNPLTAIHAALANAGDSAPAEVREAAIESVRSQALRIGSLVADLRKLSELETRPIEATRVDVTELLDEAIAAARDHPNAQSREVQLTVPRAPWPLPPIRGDWDLVFLAVYNLLSNALKYTHPGDTVEARAFEDGHDVVIEVADTGPGIPADELPLVWEELYRGRGARETPGSGLGLALVRSIVARHGGTAELRSRPGLGTVVTVRLPAARAPDPEGGAS